MEKVLEKIDTYDEDFNFLGAVKREEAHRQGLWHQNFNCWVVAKRLEPTLIFQVRKGMKKLDVTATGHLAAGETMADAVRELEEEVGIQADFEDLIPLGQRKSFYEDGEIKNREFVESFLLEDSRELKDYRLQISEVKGVVEVTVNQLEYLLKNKNITILSSYLDAESNEVSKKTFTKADLIDRSDEYYLCLADIVTRYFNGESPNSLSLTV